MLKFTQTVIFATLQKGVATVLDNLVRTINPMNFTLRRAQDGTPLVFKNIFILLEYLKLEGKSNLTNTLLILDYDILRQSEAQNIAEIFLLYPELRIKIFMDSRLQKSLFGIPIKQLKRSQLIVENLGSFIKACSSVNLRNMIFDPAAVRNHLKMEMISEIGFGVNNYARREKSRKRHFALSIDHAPHHALFVGYALYKFGYSVLPVVSYKEIGDLGAEKIRADIILRECDLQFYDMVIQEQHCKGGLNQENQKVDDFSRKIDIIRGVESVSDRWMQRKATRIRTDLYEKILHKKHGSTWFVTQYEGVDDRRVGDKISRGNFKKINDINKTVHGNPFFAIGTNKAIENQNPDFKRHGIIIGVDCNAAFLRGQSKIIKGIHSLLQCPEIKKRYRCSMDIGRINRLRRQREFHDNMAVNLQLARKMLNRARSMFLLHNYLEVAVLAIDALELSNGLSMSLSLEILNLKVKAETRLELTNVGIGNISGKEVRNKIKEIKIQVMRICKNNNETEKNSLMQYFNGLRKIYQEYEQFEAAETLYNEVLAIETGSKRYRDLKLGKRIKKYTEGKMEEKGGPSNFNMLQSIQVLAQMLITNFNVTLGLLLTLVLVTDLWWDHKLFPVAYLIMLAGFFMNPKRAIYLIIGAGINFSRFIISFFFSQLMIAFVYMVNLNRDVIQADERIVFPLNTYLQILRQTILSSLMNQPSDTLGSIMGNQADMLQWLVNGHVALSVIFLGIFITAIYRWFTKR